MAKRLRLVNTHERAVVDDEDYGWARRHTWRLYPDGHVVRDGDPARGEPAVVYLCNEVRSRRDGIPLREFDPPRPVRRRVRFADEPVEAQVIGSYEQRLVAELSYELAVRVRGDDPDELNFADEMLYDLVPIFGAALVAGLDPRLPPDLRDGIIWLVEEFGG